MQDGSKGRIVWSSTRKGRTIREGIFPIYFVQSALRASRPTDIPKASCATFRAMWVTCSEPFLLIRNAFWVVRLVTGVKELPRPVLRLQSDPKRDILTPISIQTHRRRLKLPWGLEATMASEITQWLWHLRSSRPPRRLRLQRSDRKYNGNIGTQFLARLNRSLWCLPTIAWNSKTAYKHLVPVQLIHQPAELASNR